jgi:hypothetical protein
MATPNSLFTAGQILTASQQNNFPFGLITESTLATNYANTAGSFDITGLSATWTSLASRKYLIGAMFNVSNTGSNVSQVYISTSGGTKLAEGYQLVTVANVPQTIMIYTIVTPGAGSVTYKTQIDIGAGTTTVYGTSTRASIASRMFVLDIGTA